MGKQRQSALPTWLRHRTLLAAEGVLLIGVLQELMQRWVLHYQLENTLKVAFIMLATVGVIGLLLVMVQAMIIRSLAKTHDVVKSMPVPMPVVVLHVAVFIALFYLYAWMWELPVWPMPGAPPFG